jgi:hypothetical protein
VIVLLSDGKDEDSVAKFAAVDKRIQASDVVLFSIGEYAELDRKLFMSGKKHYKLPELDVNLNPVWVLRYFADLSGGGAYFPKLGEPLEPFFSRIARELHQQYVVTYQPTATTGKDKFHTIDVRAKSSRYPSLKCARAKDIWIATLRGCLETWLTASGRSHFGRAGFQIRSWGNHRGRTKMNQPTLTRCLAGATIGFCLLADRAVSQDKTQFPCAEKEVPHYTAYRLKEPIRVDGVLNETSWQVAPRSSRFVDLISGQPTLHDTRTALLWDDNHLYVGYWVEEPNVAATLTERDSPIYKNNDVEFFVAGKDSYYEFEINAFNTIYEVFFIWEQAYDKGGFASVPEFSRTNPKVRPFNGVGFKTHPRGPRLGSWAWDFPGVADRSPRERHPQPRQG